jgi:hypothetical protein
MNDKNLRDYFLFDEVDLAVNQNGNLSDKQLAELINADKGGVNLVRVISLVLIFIAILCALPVLSTWAKHGDIVRSGIPWIIFSMMFGTFGCYTFYLGFIHKYPDISNVKVKKVEGPVRFIAMSGADHSETLYSLYIGNKKMEEVDHTLKDMMKEGDIYSVYFYDLKDKTGNHILSLEFLSKG